MKAFRTAKETEPARKTGAPARFAIIGTLGLACAAASASDANTSASAGSGYGRNGTATATAGYEGDVGFARTDTRSGRVNLARGVAVGVDEEGVALSVSNAVATGDRAVATNFNMEIERDGDVSFSAGGAVSRGPLHRSAEAGGSAGRGTAVSYAAGDSDRFGESRAWTRSRTTSRPEFRRHHHRPVIVRRR